MCQTLPPPSSLPKLLKEEFLPLSDPHPQSFLAAATLPAPRAPEPELSLMGFLHRSLLPGLVALALLLGPGCLWSHAAPAPALGALAFLAGGGGQRCLQSFRLPESHTRTLCCFKKRSLLVKPTADNFNAPSCWLQPRRRREVVVVVGRGGWVGGGCGEVVGRRCAACKGRFPRLAWGGELGLLAEPWSDWSF